MRVCSLDACMLIGKKEKGMTKQFDDSNWREEYKAYISDKRSLELLENGPKSLSQSWILGALYNKWKKMKGYKEPDPPNCQSSLEEFYAKQQQLEDTN